jgi:invasion protein IalB
MTLIFLLFATPAFADPKHLGDYQSWSAYTAQDNGQNICYLSAKPEKSEGDYTKRGPVFAEVTHRPAEHHTGIVTILGGYAYKKGVPVTLEVNGINFSLFSQGDAAFARDEDDVKIVAAMRSASTMVVKATSAHGTPTTDTFTLKGMDTAYMAISKACGVEVSPLPKPGRVPAKKS